MGRARYLVVIGAVAFAGCGETKLDAGDIESEVTPQVEEQTGTKDVTIDCSDDIEAEEGAAFECDITAQGGVEAKLKVTQEDDEGNVRWEVLQP